MKNKTKFGKEFGVGLAVVGALLLATAILLLPRFAAQGARPTATADTCGDRVSTAKPLADAPAPTLAAPTPKERVTADADKQPVASKEAPVSADKKATTAVSLKGPWRVTLGDRYAIPDSARPTIFAIATAIKENPTASFNFKGINNSKKSSKRALHGAKVLLDAVRAKQAVSNKLVDITYEQTPTAVDLTIEVEMGGAK